VNNDHFCQPNVSNCDKSTTTEIYEIVVKQKFLPPVHIYPYPVCRLACVDLFNDCYCETYFPVLLEKDLGRRWVTSFTIHHKPKTTNVGMLPKTSCPRVSLIGS
jgi:hypothetical protein